MGTGQLWEIELTECIVLSSESVPLRRGVFFCLLSAQFACSGAIDCLYLRCIGRIRFHGEGQFIMERKRHYRMYKSGKHWMTAAVVTMAVGVPLATQVPAVKAADTGNQATVTAVAQQDDSWKANAQALKDALTKGGWSSLKPSGQNTDLGTLVSNATDKATLNTSWNTVVQTISTTTLQKLLGTTDTTEINKFLSTQSSDGSYQGYTNNQVIALFVARSTIGDNQTTPTVSYPSTLNSLIVYLNRAVQVNWQTNKTALQNYLVNNGLTTVPVDASGNTIGATVNAVNDATSLNNAWAQAANVIARDEIRRQLGLPNDTNRHIASKSMNSCNWCPRSAATRAGATSTC